MTQAPQSPSIWPPYQSVDPENSTTMAQVRAGVDEIDRYLVGLLTRRQRYMEAAAVIKPDRAAVRDEWRIRDVLSKVGPEAERSGLSWAIAEPVWRELMERCIAHEMTVFDKLRGPSAPPG